MSKCTNKCKNFFYDGKNVIFRETVLNIHHVVSTVVIEVLKKTDMCIFLRSIECHEKV